MMTIEEIKEIVENSEFEYIGIRADSGEWYQIGDICRNSFDFEGRDYDEAIANGEKLEELNGTFCFCIANGGNFEKYINFGKMMEWIEDQMVFGHVYIIGTDTLNHDFNQTDEAFGCVEELFVDAEVIAKIN